LPLQYYYFDAQYSRRNTNDETMIISTESIVLKSMDLRETSRLATFFTKEKGKVKGVLKGIRKDPRKFGSNIDKFTVNDMVYYEYRRSDIHLVSQCDLKQFHFPIRDDYKRNVAANYMCELVDVIMQPEQENKKIYKLMLNYLEALQTVKDIDKLVHILQIKILQLSGFSPHLDSCVKCDKKIQGRVRFSMVAGGLVCPECPTTEMSFTLISRGTISSILHIEQKSWEQVMRLGLTKVVKKELKYILNNFLIYHLEKRIRSAKYL